MKGICRQEKTAAFKRIFLSGVLFGLSFFILAPAAALAEDSLPLTIVSNGNTYIINEFSHGTDETGNTTITITGTGYGTLLMKMNRIVIPVQCSFTSGGEEYEWDSAQTSPTSFTFMFSTSKKPETVKFYAEDDKDKKYEFKVN